MEGNVKTNKTADDKSTYPIYKTVRNGIKYRIELQKSWSRSALSKPIVVSLPLSSIAIDLIGKSLKRKRIN